MEKLIVDLYEGERLICKGIDAFIDVFTNNAIKSWRGYLVVESGVLINPKSKLKLKSSSGRSGNISVLNFNESSAGRVIIDFNGNGSFENPPA